MRPASCGITPEGWPTIGITALTALVFACLGWPVPAVLALALCWFAFHFFRDPERVVPTRPAWPSALPMAASSASSASPIP